MEETDSRQRRGEGWMKDGAGSGRRTHMHNSQTHNSVVRAGGGVGWVQTSKER